MISDEYLAGFVDGEGCISIVKARRKNGSYQYYSHVTVSNSFHPLLDELREDFGGSIQVGHQATAKHKTGYSLNISGSRAEDVLVRILPHLKIKRAQAKLALQFIFYVRSVKREMVGQHGAKPLRTSDLELRERFYRISRTLNRKGPKGVNNTWQ